MPGFLDRVKSGAGKAAFEADRLRRQTQAQAGVKSLQRELESQVTAMGQRALDLYDAGTLSQPELLAICQQIDILRGKIADQEAEVERIRQEKQAGAPAETGEAAPAEPVTPAAVSPLRQQSAETHEPEPEPEPEPQGRTCPNCNSTVEEGVKFCPECGSKLPEA